MEYLKSFVYPAEVAPAVKQANDARFEKKMKATWSEVDVKINLEAIASLKDSQKLCFPAAGSTRLAVDERYFQFYQRSCTDDSFSKCHRVVKKTFECGFIYLNGSHDVVLYRLFVQATEGLKKLQTTYSSKGDAFDLFRAQVTWNVSVIEKIARELPNTSEQLQGT